jgi:glycosyltransferase-like protein
MSRLRVAILAHSTSPRGGVVHALELGDALVRLGHEAVVHAPDPRGTGFFRETLCRTVSVPAEAAGVDVAAMVRQRVADYVRHFEPAANRDFDVFHAQDSISGNALAALKARGLIRRFARTVHHVDVFDDRRLRDLQECAIVAADRHFVVSRHWAEQLEAQFGLLGHVVGNGVDLRRYSDVRDARDCELRRRLGLGAGPVFVAIGGVEERKNTWRILQAFAALRTAHPTAQLLIAGGASLLDHSAYRQNFDAALAASRLPENAVLLAGPLPQQEMPALYRVADALVFPSVKEGFGLVVLEAMASGLPVVVSRIAPFTEYLGESDAAWCDPYDTVSIVDAMRATLDPARRGGLIDGGLQVAARHDWSHTAHAHLEIYAKLKEVQHA